MQGAVLPAVEKTYKLRPDAYSRAIAGASSGAICAFNAGWYHPNQFSRVLSHIGSYVALQWHPEKGQVVKQRMPASASPAQVANVLKGTVKADEARETGIHEWLAAQGAKVTRQEVLDHLEENRIAILEITYGGESTHSQRSQGFTAWRDENYTYDAHEGLWRRTVAIRNLVPRMPAG